MSSKQKLPKALRVTAIVLLGLTAVFTLLGGIGTTCVAFKAEQFGPKMAALVPVKPIFQVLVVVSIAAALYGLYATFSLARARLGAYRASLIFLLVGLVASGIQFYYSATLRGSTAPNNVRLYLTGFTLVVFLLMRLAGPWEEAGARGKTMSGFATPGGLALLVGGVVTLTCPMWAGPTHVMNGINQVNVLLVPLQIVGTLMALSGGALLLRPRVAQSAKEGKRFSV